MCDRSLVYDLLTVSYFSTFLFIRHHHNHDNSDRCVDSVVEEGSQVYRFVLFPVSISFIGGVRSGRTLRVLSLTKVQSGSCTDSPHDITHWQDMDCEEEVFPGNVKREIDLSMSLSRIHW